MGSEYDEIQLRFEEDSPLDYMDHFEDALVDAIRAWQAETPEKNYILDRRVSGETTRIVRISPSQRYRIQSYLE